MSGIIGYDKKGSGIIGLGTRAILLTDLCSLVNSWVVASSGWEPIIQRSSEGLVHCYGTIKGGATGSGSEVCTLPVGWRPSKTHQFQDWSEDNNGTGTYSINVDGAISFQPTGHSRTSAGHWIGLKFTYYI